MTTVDPLSAAVERLRASVDALPEQVRGDWLRHGGFVNARDGGEPVADARPSCTPTAVSVAEHIALTASPPTVRLLADLLDALQWLPSTYGTATDEQYAADIRAARDALASHLTEGSTTP